MTIRSQQVAPALSVNRLNLDRLLSRLEHIVLTDDGSLHLKHDVYERRRVSANVEYARSLLLRLERESAAVKVYSRKQSLQSELEAKRDAIKKLNRRLRELDQLDQLEQLDEDEDEDGNGDGDDVNSGNDENRFGNTGITTRTLDNHSNGYAPARAVSTSLDTNGSEGADRSVQRAAGELSSVLRARRGQGTSGAAAVAGQDLAAASGNSANPHSTSQPTISSSSSPFQPLVPASASAPDETTRIAQQEKLLTHNRAEEQALTESLLSMAQALKLSARQFHTTLETDKEVLDAAVGGLDKNVEGMDAAGRRMGQLKRKTSGWAWWRHVSLYVWIAGLYVALVMVFLLPKLRL